MNISILYARSSGQRSVQSFGGIDYFVDAFFGYGSKFLNPQNLSWGPFGTLILTYCHVGMARNSSQRLDKKHMEGGWPQGTVLHWKTLDDMCWFQAMWPWKPAVWCHLRCCGVACGKRWANAESGLTLEVRIWRIGWGNFCGRKILRGFIKGLREATI